MQADDPPIACTLVRDALDRRLAWIRRVTARSLISHQLDGATLRLTYRLDAMSDLDEIVTRERECCAFLRFALARSGDAIQLDIYAPEGFGADARWLFDQFLPSEQPGGRRSACGCAPGPCG